MRTLGWAMVLGVMLTPLEAETVKWIAKGEVTGVVASGEEGFAPLGIMNGEMVEVEFRYDDVAGPTGPGEGIRDFSAFGWLVEWDYFQGIDLQVRIQVGSHVWAGAVDTAAKGTPYTVWVQDVIGNIESEFLVATVSDDASEGGVFSSFPGKSSTGESALAIEFRDREHPFAFLSSRFLPRAMEPTIDELTSASGVIRSGGESISFSINPATIVVADGPAGEAVLPLISVVGGEVILGWTAEIGAEYTIRWSENGRQWGVLTTVIADAVSEAHTFTPTGGPAAQFYRVSKND